MVAIPLLDADECLRLIAGVCLGFDIFTRSVHRVLSLDFDSDT